MGLIVGLITGVLCVVVSIKMLKREQPAPMEKKQAALPYLLGLAAPILSTFAAILFAVVISRATNGTVQELPVVLRSFISSFIIAGFTEELIKLLLLMIAIKAVKPGNVYRFALLGAGVGCGFTGLEDITYGGTSLAVAITRLPTFALHMSFGVIMGLHLGLAEYARHRDDGECRKHRFLALALPVLWHTVYDAATASNHAMKSEDEVMQVAGVAVALLIVIISVILQFKILGKLKKKCAEYCEMSVEQ